MPSLIALGIDRAPDRTRGITELIGNHNGLIARFADELERRLDEDGHRRTAL